MGQKWRERERKWFWEGGGCVSQSFIDLGIGSPKLIGTFGTIDKANQ
jgi:hypothetical protein